MKPTKVLLLVLLAVGLIFVGSSAVVEANNSTPAGVSADAAFPAVFAKRLDLSMAEGSFQLNLDAVDVAMQGGTLQPVSPGPATLQITTCPSTCVTECASTCFSQCPSGCASQCASSCISQCESQCFSECDSLCFSVCGPPCPKPVEPK